MRKLINFLIYFFSFSHHTWNFINSSALYHFLATLFWSALAFLDINWNRDFSNNLFFSINWDLFNYFCPHNLFCLYTVTLEKLELYWEFKYLELDRFQILNLKRFFQFTNLLILELDKLLKLLDLIKIVWRYLPLHFSLNYSL